MHIIKTSGRFQDLKLPPSPQVSSGAAAEKRGAVTVLRTVSGLKSSPSLQLRKRTDTIRQLTSRVGREENKEKNRGSW